MKKQYIQPSMKAYRVKTSSMICTSPQSLSLGTGTQPTSAEGKGNYDDDWE